MLKIHFFLVCCFSLPRESHSGWGAGELFINVKYGVCAYVCVHMLTNTNNRCMHVHLSWHVVCG